MPIESVSAPPLRALPSGAPLPGLALSGHFERLSEIARTAGDRVGGWRGIHDLFDEMLEKDGHLHSVIQTRMHGVLGRDRAVIPAGEGERDAAVAAWTRALLEATPGWEAALRWLLGSLAHGVAVVEIEWAHRAEGDAGPGGPARRHGWVAPSGFRRRPPQEFVFDAEGHPMLLTGPDRLWWGQPTAALRAAPVDPLRVMVMRFDDGPDNPFGVGLCQRAFWLHWFKKQTLKAWLIHNDKFGQPTIIGKYPSGTSQTDQEALLEVVESIQTDAGVTIPENMVLEMLEARRAGNVNTYRDLLDWCNDEISKVVLGETLTTDEGRRSGSLALGRIHDIVRNETIEADAQRLMAVVNEQLIAPLIQFNFGADTAPPRWVIDTSKDEDLAEQIRIDRELLAAGVPLALDHFYRKYHREAPANGERPLRYDDQNLYQYHLEFGVLTINEVRRSLGLPPVGWGDGPPQRRSPVTTNDNEETNATRLATSDEDPLEEREEIADGA